MNILYISHLSTNIAAGPNWSVPASIEAQSKIDNVLWVNLTDAVMSHWKQIAVYHNISEFGSLSESLDCLPKPFSNPDIVVFEGFYYMDDVKVAKFLINRNIPYIIIPRGSLTNQAKHNHAWFKKWIAHKLFFDEFIKHAAAIQYLTKQEADDSKDKNHTPYIIIPNGFYTPVRKKEVFSENAINAVFIGRLDMYHKGIDLLLEAMEQLHTGLRKAHFFLNIYGPKRYDYYKIEKEIIEKNLTDIVAIHDEVAGEDKEKVLLDSDLFIMTSRFEGHPMGLIEALAYGLPCLVTPGTNMIDEIAKENAGWVCEGNVSSISKILDKIMIEKDQFSMKGQNGRKLSKYYDWNRLAVDFHNSLVNYR